MSKQFKDLFLKHQDCFNFFDACHEVVEAMSDAREILWLMNEQCNVDRQIELAKLILNQLPPTPPYED